MSTEPQETRHLVQARNPPVSDAAARALEALRANGEFIPLDLSPQPIDGDSSPTCFDEL
jgi:sugar/nucleoside kinase (ribokinase family)